MKLLLPNLQVKYRWEHRFWQALSKRIGWWTKTGPIRRDCSSVKTRKAFNNKKWSSRGFSAISYSMTIRLSKCNISTTQKTIRREGSAPYLVDQRLLLENKSKISKGLRNSVMFRTWASSHHRPDRNQIQLEYNSRCPHHMQQYSGR